MKELNSLYQEKITVRLKNSIIFLLIFFSMVMESSIRFTYLVNNYGYIKDFNRLMFNKTKDKKKKYFCRYCLQCFSGENILTDHKKNCLIINGKQNAKLGKGSISFKNYSKQLPVPFKIYADFECILRPTSSLKKINNKNTSYTEKYQSHIPCSFSFKVICIDSKFSKDIVIYRGKDAIYKFIEKNS